MSSRSDKLQLSKILCRFGILLAWLLAAANITFYLQSAQKAGTQKADMAENSTSNILSDLVTMNNPVAADAAIEIAGVSINALHINIGLSIFMAILATALLAMAIALIDLRNLQARRSRN